MEQDARAGSLFGAHPGSVRTHEGVDLIAAALDVQPDAETGREVTDRLLLDTHVALWLDSGDERLRASTRALIDGCWQKGGAIFLSAVTAWEIALLVDTRRIDLDIPVDA